MSCYVHPKVVMKELIFFGQTPLYLNVRISIK
jgi:hypothetical protein